MTIHEILEKNVSLQENAWSEIESEVNIGAILSWIKSGKYELAIKQLRHFLMNNNSDQYDLYKKRLPGVTFSATFDQLRRRETLKNYTYLLTIDIDRLESSQMNHTKSTLLEDQYVFSYWESPSQRGIKGLIELSYRNPVNNDSSYQAHKIAFECVHKYFMEKYGINIDKSGSDLTRLCFLSFDPNLVIKEGTVAFEVENPIVQLPDQSNVIKRSSPKGRPGRILPSKAILFDPKGKNLAANRTKIQSIIKYLKKRNKSITSTYEDWFRVGYAIANSFTYDIGEKYYLQLCRLDGVKHDENASKNMLLYCYENSRNEISFSKITYLAKEQGYN